MNQKKFIIAIFSVFVILLLSGCTTNDTKNDSFNENWLENYSPIHAAGTGENDFWIEYPTINPNSSQTVNHLSWVSESLEEGCMLFVVHITGCVSCQPQADRVIELAEKYKENVVFHDLDSKQGGLVERRAYEAYLYDPDGPPGIIALTGVFTLIEQNGSVAYGWHSWEQDVSFKEMEQWVKDGIYYWYENSGGIK
jgi:hypothetical protein